MRSRAQSSLAGLLGGGLLGAILFYLITNTAAWLFNPFHNPEYARNLAGWFIALTKGTAGYPIIEPHTLVFVISQSGETADTLAALREASHRGGGCQRRHKTSAPGTPSKHSMVVRTSLLEASGLGWTAH